MAMCLWLCAPALGCVPVAVCPCPWLCKEARRTVPLAMCIPGKYEKQRIPGPKFIKCSQKSPGICFYIKSPGIKQ